MVKNYLKIQQVRFGESLSVRLSLPHPESLLAASVPAMLLQIHVENAVKGHPQPPRAVGRFSLEIAPTPLGWLVTIEDDGRGRPGLPKPPRHRARAARP